nr:hypothetical protein CFP56_66135 [Quercus suber]
MLRSSLSVILQRRPLHLELVSRMMDTRSQETYHDDLPPIVLHIPHRIRSERSASRSRSLSMTAKPSQRSAPPALSRRSPHPYPYLSYMIILCSSLPSDPLKPANRICPPSGRHRHDLTPIAPTVECYSNPPAASAILPFST